MMSDFLATLDAKAAELGLDEQDDNYDYYADQPPNRQLSPDHDDTIEFIKFLRRETALSNSSSGQLEAFNQLSPGRQNLWLAARILSIQERLSSVSDRTEKGWQLSSDAAKAVGKMVEAYIRAPDTEVYLPDQEALDLIVEGWVRGSRLGSITVEEWGSSIKRRTIARSVARKLTDCRGALKTAVC